MFARTQSISAEPPITICFPPPDCNRRAERASCLAAYAADPSKAAAGEAAAALANMCYDNVNNQRAVVRAGGVEALVGVLRANPNSASAQKAAAVLANLCYADSHNWKAVRPLGGPPEGSRFRVCSVLHPRFPRPAEGSVPVGQSRAHALHLPCLVRRPASSWPNLCIVVPFVSGVWGPRA